MITYYTRSVAKAGGVDRLSGAFATLAPMVRDYLRAARLRAPRRARRQGRSCAGSPRTTPRRSSSAPFARRSARCRSPSASRRSRRARCGCPRPLPFPWSRETVDGKRTVFNLTPVDNALEARFARFLDRAEDVTALAKLTMNTRFALEYISATGRAALLLPRLRRAADRRLVPGRRDQGPGGPRRRAEGPPRAAVVPGRRSRSPGRDWAYEKVPQKLFDKFDGDTRRGPAAVPRRERDCDEIAAT